jgi:hypothetical protein
MRLSCVSFLRFAVAPRTSPRFVLFNLPEAGLTQPKERFLPGSLLAVGKWEGAGVEGGAEGERDATRETGHIEII